MPLVDIDRAKNVSGLRSERLINVLLSYHMIGLWISPLSLSVAPVCDTNWETADYENLIILIWVNIEWVYVSMHNRNYFSWTFEEIIICGWSVLSAVLVITPRWCHYSLVRLIFLWIGVDSREFRWMMKNYKKLTRKMLLENFFGKIFVLWEKVLQLEILVERTCFKSKCLCRFFLKWECWMWVV